MPRENVLGLGFVSDVQHQANLIHVSAGECGWKCCALLLASESGYIGTANRESLLRRYSPTFLPVAAKGQACFQIETGSVPEIERET